MQFEELDRVVFDANPLAEVVCQLRFPQLLELEQFLPVDFQKLIRRRFQNFDKRRNISIGIGDDAPSGSVTQSFVYDFSDHDQIFKLSLASTFLAISTNRYERWEKFIGELIPVLQALVDVYEIPYFQRIGLRYVNIIDRNELGLEAVPWTDLLKARLLGPLQDGAVPEEDLVELRTFFRIKLQRGNATVRAGLVERAGRDQHAFVIDSDFFEEGKFEAETGAPANLLDEFNTGARNLFRWCIEPTLFEALRPRGLS